MGDPARPGDLVVQRVRLMGHAIVPPHTHPFAETVTVIAGAVGFGLGEKVDPSAMASGRLFPVGGFYAHAAYDPHYVWAAESGAVVQVQFVAPGGITYVDPRDDPRRK